MILYPSLAIVNNIKFYGKWLAFLGRYFSPGLKSMNFTSGNFLPGLYVAAAVVAISAGANPPATSKSLLFKISQESSMSY